MISAATTTELSPGTSPSGADRTWAVHELPTGTSRCREVRGDDQVQIIVEFPDRHRALVDIKVPVNREGLAELLRLGNRPIAVLLIRREACLMARIIAISPTGEPCIEVDIGTALACLESGVHGTLRC